MLIATLPFLMGALTLGTIALLVFLAATVIFTIPVFANRGKAQVIWALVVGGVLTLLGAGLVTIVVLQSNGTIEL